MAFVVCRPAPWLPSACSGHGRQESAARGTLGVSPRLLGVSRVVLAVGRPGSVAGAPPCTHPATVWPG